MIEIQEWWSELEGKTEDEARAIAESHGWRIRVTSVDGKFFMVTQDYRRDRLNVSIVDGKVKAKPFKVG